MTAVKRVRTQPAGTARGAVCFTWDDGYSSHLDTVAAAAGARNQRHTFCVYTDALGTNGRLTSAQVTTLYSRKHEIACHSKAHEVVTSKSAAERETEYGAKTTLEGYTASGAITTWAYPEGIRNATCDTELALRFDRVLGVSGSTPSSLPFLIPAYKASPPYVIGRFNWDGSARAHQQVLNYIRMAASQPVIFVVYSHDIDGSSSVTEAQMIEAMDLAEDLEVPCVTLSEAFPKYNHLVDGGFEDSNLYGWYKIQSGGTFTAESIADTPYTNMGGSRSLHLQCTSDSGTVYVQQTVPVSPGVAYTLSGRYRVSTTSGAGAISARVRERDYAGGSVGSTASALAGTSWAQFTCARTFGATGAFALIELEIVNLTAEAWFDHVVFAPTLTGVHG